MKRLFIFLTAILFVGTVHAQTNTYKYRIHANGGVTIPKDSLKIGTVLVTRTAAQLNFVDATSSIQGQLDAKLNTADSTSGAGKYATDHRADVIETDLADYVDIDNTVVLKADSTTGTGHYVSQYQGVNLKYQFRSNITSGAPKTGDSIFLFSSLIGKHLEIWRSGHRQYFYTTTNNTGPGFVFNSTIGQIIFSPVFAADERVIVIVSNPVLYTAIPALQNLVTHSETIDDGTYWGGTNVAYLANQEVDLVGNTTLERITTSNVTHNSLYVNNNNYCTVVAGTTYRWSFDVKRGTMTDLKWSVYDHTNSADIISSTSYYSQTASTVRRVYCTFTAPAGCTVVRLMFLRDSGVTGTVFVGRAQLESNGSYYIKTTTTAIQ